eukprot:15345644-Ditylum_brightwellii.AAC.2
MVTTTAIYLQLKPQIHSEYFQNINGLATEEDIKSNMDLIHTKEVDIWGWVETNVNWTPNLISKVQYLGRKKFCNFTVNTSSSNNLVGFYQQGGMCIGVTGNMTGRIIEGGSDNS